MCIPTQNSIKDINETRFDGVTDHNIGDYVKAAENILRLRKCNYEFTILIT